MAAASARKAAKAKPQLYRVGRAHTGLGLFGAQVIPER